jgi:hypothetical protein
MWFPYNTPATSPYRSSAGLMTPLPPRLRTLVLDGQMGQEGIDLGFGHPGGVA